jgi:hypothetical protein
MAQSRPISQAMMRLLVNPDGNREVVKLQVLVRQRPKANKASEEAILDKCWVKGILDEEIVPISAGIPVFHENFDLFRGYLAPGMGRRVDLEVPDIVFIGALGKIFSGYKAVAETLRREQGDIAHNGQYTPLFAKIAIPQYY